MQLARKELTSVFKRSDAVLSVSERLMDMIAGSGVQTSDTMYLELVQRVAGDVSSALEGAVQSGRISMDDLFDERYVPIEGSHPQQFTNRFNELADALMPGFQEAGIKALPDIMKEASAPIYVAGRHWGGLRLAYSF